MHDRSLELLEAVLINSDAAATQLLVRAGIIGECSQIPPPACIVLDSGNLCGKQQSVHVEAYGFVHIPSLSAGHSARSLPH